MPKFAANLTMMFNEYEFLERFAAAASAGFKAVEYFFPYPYPADQLAEMLGRHGLKQVLFNFPAGNWDAGDRGIACLPDRVGEFQDGVGKVAEYARALGCSQVNCLAGIPPKSADPDKVRETLVSNLRFAARNLKGAGVHVLVEAINTLDMPGFYVNRTGQARSIIEEVGEDNVSLQYDVYHMQIMEGDLARRIESNLDRIRHIQMADNPGRHEPGTGEINYTFLFAYIDKLGYNGWIGCEYRPLKETESGLAWMAPYTGGSPPV